MVYLDCPEVSQKVELGIFKLAYKLDHKVRQLVVDHTLVVDTEPLLRGVVDRKLVRLEVNTSCRRHDMSENLIMYKVPAPFLGNLGITIWSISSQPVLKVDKTEMIFECNILYEVLIGKLFISSHFKKIKFGDKLYFAFFLSNKVE